MSGGGDRIPLRSRAIAAPVNRTLYRASSMIGRVKPRNDVGADGGGWLGGKGGRGKKKVDELDRSYFFFLFLGEGREREREREKERI